MGNGEWKMRNWKLEMASGKCRMGNGKLKWEETVVNVLLEWAQLPCFGDRRKKASVAIGQLSMEAKSIFFVFFAIKHHRKAY